MESNQRRVISLLVDNQSGVLARVSNLFCRRGFNIDSLTVSATNDPTVSRITVAVSGTEKELNQLILQTERLEVTRQVFVLNHENALERELLLLKVAADVHNRAELREVGSIYKATTCPVRMVMPSNWRWSEVRSSMRAMWGTARAMNAMGPQKAVTTAVSRPVSTRSARRNALTSTPRFSA